MYVYYKGDDVYTLLGDASLSFEFAAKPYKRRQRISASASHCHKISAYDFLTTSCQYPRV